MSNKFTVTQVKHVATLADIPISEAEAKQLASDFDETLSVIDNLQSVDTSGVEPTHQVTGLTNIWREDEVNKEKMLTQEQALRNAKKTYEGFFMVDHILENKDA